jgi:hypothetical protein
LYCINITASDYLPLMGDSKRQMSAD